MPGRWVEARRRDLLARWRARFDHLEDSGSRYVLDPASRLGHALHWATSACAAYTVGAEPYLLALQHYVEEREGTSSQEIERALITRRQNGR